MCFFIDFVLDSWFAKWWCRSFSKLLANFFFQFVCHDCDVFRFLDKNGSDFGVYNSDFLSVFFLLDKLLSPVWVFVSLSLIGVHMESRRRGDLFFFSKSPWRHFFSRGFVDDCDRDIDLLFPSLVFDVIFLYRLGGVFRHFDFPSLPIDRWVVFLEPW